MNRTRFGAGSRAVLLGVGAATAATSAMAQAPAVADSGQLDEIIVQARKYNENLQEVPLSISVITAEDIARQGLVSTEDIARLDPSVIFDYGGAMSDMRVVIRGLSPTRGRVNSAILVDGVDVTSESIQFAGGSQLAGSRLFDLEQVEIVKGPQAALYGRSAFAGAISYRTKDPSSESGGEVRIDGADYGRYSLGAGFDLPVNENFGMRLSGTYWSSDGVYRNQALNAKVGGGDGFGLAFTAKWQASEAFTARLRVEYNDDEEDLRGASYLRHNTRIDPNSAILCTAAVRPTSPTCVFTGTTQGPTGPGSATRAFFWGSVGEVSDYPGLQPRYSPDPTTGQMYPGATREVMRANLNLAWELGPGKLTSITGYTDADQFFWQDLDYDSIWDGTTDTSRRISEFRSDTTTKQLTQELRWQSDFDGMFNFAIGGQYYKAEDDSIAASISVLCNTQFVNCGGPVPAGPPGVFVTIFPEVPASRITGVLNPLDRAWGRELEHQSIYGMLEFDFTERLSFEVEARYSDESESIYGPICDLASTTFTWPPGTATAGGTFPFPITQVCQDPTMTIAGSPYAGTPVAQFFRGPFSIDFPSQFALYSGIGANANPRQQPSITARTPDYDSTFTTWRTYLSFKATEDIHVYGTVGRSIKPGGRSTVTAGNWLDGDYNGVFDDTLYGPEKLTAAELGLKMQWLDNRLRTNFAIFQQQYDQKQIGVQTITPSGIPVGRVINSGEAKVDGFEADVQWRATENLSFAAAYSYLDARYTKFRFESNSSTDAIRYGDCTRVVRTTATGPAYLCDVNALANRELKLEDVPEHAFVLQGRYQRPMSAFGGSSWYVEADAQVQGERFIDAANRRWVDEYELANLRVGLIGPDGQWEVMLYANNLFDDDTILSAQDNPGEPDAALFNPTQFGPTDAISVTLPDPRIVGLRFNWRFGGASR